MLFNFIHFSGTWSFIHFSGTWSVYPFHRQFLYLSLEAKAYFGAYCLPTRQHTTGRNCLIEHSLASHYKQIEIWIDTFFSILVCCLWTERISYINTLSRDRQGAQQFYNRFTIKFFWNFPITLVPKKYLKCVMFWWFNSA